jgi:hypothetical protein
MTKTISKAAAGRIQKQYKMPMSEFLEEHHRLLRILRTGSRNAQKHEADEQAEEVAKATKKRK